ncbi:hypothetical protein Gpo141_00000602 [Globisporangium polare]
MGNAPSSGNAHTTRFLAGCPEIPPTPTGSDVPAQFEGLLRAKGVPAPAAEELAALESLDTKWMYVFLSNLPAESVAKDWLEPRECVLQVVHVQHHLESIHELFCAIRINIILRSREWVAKFIAADGVGALVTLLQSSSTPASTVVLEEAVDVLITLAAFSDGLVEITEVNGCCMGLLTALETCTAPATKVRTLKLLGMMCGHSKSTREIVLSTVISSAAPEERPFCSICQQVTANPSEPVLQTAVVTFLNDLLGSITNSAHRVAIRDDLVSHRFVSALEEYRLKAETSAELRSAVELFMTAHQSDLSAREDDIQAVPAKDSSKWTVTITPAFASDETSEATEKREAFDEEPAEETHVNASQDREDETSSLPAPSDSASVSEPKADAEDSETAQEPGNQVEEAMNEDFVSEVSATVLSADPEVTSTSQSTPEQVSSPQQSSMLQTLISQLESQQLDDVTSQKIARVLQTLVESMSAEKAKGMEVVDRLEKSLTARSNQSEEERSEATTESSSNEDSGSGDPLQRVRMRLLSGFDDNRPSAAASPGKSSVSKSSSLFQSFESFFSGSAAPTPAKPTVANAPDCASSSEPSGGVCAGSPVAENEGDASRKPAVPKLTLPFFQSFRKGPGLGATPASTPIATASVRKDAKRHSFSSFASLPLPMMAEGGLALPGSGGGSSALPSLSLTPMLPAIEKTSLAVNVPSRLEQSSEDANGAAAPPATGTDVSKFRKLLSMGAPKEAVRAKMRQAGLDPDLLDEKLGFDAPSPRSATLSSSHPPPPTPIVSEASSDEPTSSSLASSGPDISKFRKLLSMGAPLAAVKAKMVQVGLDPNLLDQKVGFSEPSLPAPAAPVTSGSEPKPDEASESAFQGPDISKFKKLLTMGAPLAAVKAKMMQAGLDPALLDGSVPTTAAVSSPLPAAAKVLVKDDPEYAKFFKLQSMGAPAAAVKAKMRQAGLNSDLLDTPDAEMPGKGDSGQAAPAKKPVVLVKEDPEYAKFFKLLSMGAPAPTVKAKMQMAGLKPELLDTPDAVLVGPEEEMPAATLASIPLVLVKDDPEYAKFFKLLSMGAPAPTVKAKMQMAGLKPELLDTPDAPLNPPAAQQPLVLVKDDPEYAKFFKLLGMGAPPPTVKAKMQMAGLRPELLDTPDAVLTPATTGAAVGAGDAKPPAATANRRAHLAISIKPPVKQTTRSFYWQQLKGEAIKGTIWEEIEKESSEQSNQVPLVLSEGDLAVLEAEFPPPQAANGPGTAGTRGRTNSVDHTANGGPPGSPMGSPRVVFLIDRSRANNISIIIKQFRMSNAALREAIMKLDANVLTIERVQGLLKIMPTEEEIAAITGFQGDPLTLNEAERILKELISVPRLKQRLSALQAKLQFPTLVRDLQTKVTKLRTASTEISQSTEFKSTLLVVLQVGNKMNQGTNRGDAKGFRLGDLTKLAQLKSVDKAVTLLHFVARMIRLKKGNLVRLGDALSSLYDVQNIPIPELQADMFKITEVIGNVGNELSAQKLKNSIEEKESCDLFVKVMDEFMDTATTTTAALKDELDSTMQLLKDTMKRFDKDTDAADAQAPESSGPPTAASMAGACEFFSIVYEFSVALTKADRENELRRLKEERQQKLQQQKSQLPTRSHSSVDLLAGRSKIGRDEVAGSKADDKAGPETPEKSLLKKDSSSRMAGRGSIFGTASVTRSVSMSAILEPVIQPVTGTAVPSTKPGKTPERPPVAEKSKLKKPVAVTTGTDSSASSKPPHPTPRAGKRTEESGAKTTTKSQTKKDDKTATAKEKPKSKAKTMMAVPGKIIKATKHGSNIVSPLKIVPNDKSPVSESGNSDSPGSGPLSSLKKMANSSIEKSKRRASSGERIVPFDGVVSLEDIRSKLERKHSLQGGARDQSSKPETESEAEDLYDNNSSRPVSEQEEEVVSEAALGAAVGSLQAVL